jgi:Ice-binding-like
MSTNFNDTVPAPPSGGVNVKWQTDGSGNDSAYLAVGGTSTSFSSISSGTNVGSSSPVSAHLGSASNYAILASSGITNTGSTVISGGNIGSSPTPSITGFPPGTFVFPAQIDNADAGAAQTALASAIAFYSSLSTTVIPSELGGQMLTPGNYSFASGAALLSGGTLTLNGAGTYVIKTASTLTVAAGSIVVLTGGATVDNVVFVIGSSATFAGANTFIGNILAHTSITLNGGTFNGRALANTGAVTISSATTITAPSGSTTLTVGSGSTLSFSGTGIINANEIMGFPIFFTSLVPGDVIVWNGFEWVNAGLPAVESLFLPVFANNAAALSGGLVAGGLYRTGGNPDTVCVVH